MTIPATAVPDLRTLVAPLSKRSEAGEAWVREGYSPKIGFFKRGSFAIAAALQAFQKREQSTQLSTWFPDYFCNEPLNPVRALGAQIKFYPVDENLRPDWNWLRRHIQRATNQVFVLVHYFGFPNCTPHARDFCDDAGLLLLEDAAHVLVSAPGIGLADAVVFSPRKLLPVPAGGLLVTSSVLSDFVEVPAVSGSSSETYMWAFQRIVQRTLIAFGIPWHRFSWNSGQPETAVAENGSDIILEHNLGCDAYTRRMISALSRGLNSDIQSRRRNYRLFEDRLRNNPELRLLIDALPDGVCPYAMPVLLGRESDNVAATLQRTGMPVFTWPDLPPEVLRDPQTHRVAIDLRHRLLLLPVHQSLTPKEIDIISSSVTRTLGIDSAA